MEFVSAIVSASLFFTFTFLLVRSHHKELATGNSGKGFWLAWWLIMLFGGGVLYFQEHPFVWDVLCDIAGMLIVAAAVYGAVTAQRHLMPWLQSDPPAEGRDR